MPSAKRVPAASKFRMGLARGTADPVVDAVLSATSNAQKAAVIVKAAEGWSNAELGAWIAALARKAWCPRTCRTPSPAHRPPPVNAHRLSERGRRMEAPTMLNQLTERCGESAFDGPSVTLHAQPESDTWQASVSLAHSAKVIVLPLKLTR